MGRSKKKISTLQLANLRSILSSGIQFLGARKIPLRAGNYFYTDKNDKLLGSCLLGGVLLKYCAAEKRNWHEYKNKNILCFETVRQIMNCSKQKLRMIILGFDESFEIKEPRMKNECYKLGFSFGKNK